MLKSGMKWMFLIIGTTIGAGYASGRELWEFFGPGSEIAIILFVICFSIATFAIMNISFRRQTTDYRPVLEEIVGKRFVVFYDGMIFLYLYTTTVVMLAGSGATGQVYHLPYGFGVIFLAIVLIMLFYNGIHNTLMINLVLIPILIIALVYVLILFSIDEQISFLSQWTYQDNWLAAFPFTALNIFPLIAVLGAIGQHIQSEGEIWLASLGSALILGIISYLYNNSLIHISHELNFNEIPLFVILKRYSISMNISMSILLWFAILTTAAAGMIGIVSRIRRHTSLETGVIVSLALCTIIPMTAIGFGPLIHYTYPVYGILNLYVLTRLLFYRST
ncbi:MAG TPA: hypothetical protein VIG73_00840 [Cerasibacillus sp.]|uniref:hypothetical protein n=1 Tax=Cerasibacillus sp. TaxID=2498711 RepID=UPI002F3F2497